MAYYVELLHLYTNLFVLQEYYTARQNQNIHASESSQKLSLFAYSMSEEYYNWPENLTFCDLFSVKGVIELHLFHKTDFSSLSLAPVLVKYFICIYCIGFSRVGLEILKNVMFTVVEKLYNWVASFLFFKCIANFVTFSDQYDLLSPEKMS